MSNIAFLATFSVVTAFFISHVTVRTAQARTGPKDLYFDIENERINSFSCI